MKILGIDPGLAITGYGLIDSNASSVKLIEAGVIRPVSKDKIEKRLLDLYKKVFRLIKETAPEAIVLEELYSHYKHPRTSILMGHARGIICLAVEQEKIPLISYPTTRIKKAITGRGRASKEQMQRTITNLLGLKRPPEPFDITDALALAITHANVWAHQLKYDS